jgi:hypothetical protein
LEAPDLVRTLRALNDERKKAPEAKMTSDPFVERKARLALDRFIIELGRTAAYAYWSAGQR